MSRLVRDDRGQSLLAAALFLAFIGVVLLAAIGVAAAYSHVAQVQAAADAAALAGARAAKATDVRVGPNTICRLAEIDPQRAVSEAQAYWQANLSGTALETEGIDVQLYPGNRPTRFSWLARVTAPTGLLNVIGSPILSVPVVAEATLEQSCKNTLTGPVFALSRPLPPGWPVAAAEWVWNWPAADRNAPVGWPIYLVQTFELPTDQAVTVYAAADADYEIGIDTEVVLSGSGTAVKSVSTNLSSGPHMLWVKATNEAPDSPFAGPNPAGIIVGVLDSQSRVVAATKGNPITDLGKPLTESDWGSWSPPNPDWTVYVDPFYPMRLVTGGEQLANLLQDLGFTARMASELRSWMLTAIGGSRAPRTVLVMAQDVVPDAVANAPDSSALIRHYLNAGGNVLWLGDAPFFSQGQADGTDVTWGESAQEQVLGVPGPNTYWTADPGIPVTVAQSAAGYAIGVTPWWRDVGSQRAVPPHCWLQPLATASNGGIAMWRMSYWPMEPNCNKGAKYIQDAWRENAPGFVRIWDGGVALTDHQSLLAALSVAGQMAGWYRGQVP